MDLKEEEKTYEFGLIVGTKREREYWQNKIKAEIKKREQKLVEFRSTFEEFFDEEMEYHNDLHNMQSKIIMLENLLKEE